MTIDRMTINRMTIDRMKIDRMRIDRRTIDRYDKRLEIVEKIKSLITITYKNKLRFIINNVYLYFNKYLLSKYR